MLEVLDLLVIISILVPTIERSLYILTFETRLKTIVYPNIAKYHTLVKKLQFIRRFFIMHGYWSFEKNELPLEFIAESNMNKFMVYQIIKVMPAK